MRFIPTTSLGQDRLWVLLCIPFEISLRWQGDFGFHWAIWSFTGKGDFDFQYSTCSWSPGSPTRLHLYVCLSKSTHRLSVNTTFLQRNAVCLGFLWFWNQVSSFCYWEMSKGKSCWDFPFAIYSSCFPLCLSISLTQWKQTCRSRVISLKRHTLVQDAVMFRHGVAISFEKQIRHCHSWGISFILWRSLMLDIKHWSQCSLGVPLWVTGCRECPASWERLVTGFWSIPNVHTIAAMLGAKILLCMSLSLKFAFNCAEVQLWSAQNAVFGRWQRLFGP